MIGTVGPRSSSAGGSTTDEGLPDRIDDRRCNRRGTGSACCDWLQKICDFVAQLQAVQFLQAVRAAQFSYFAANGSFCGSTTEPVQPPRIPGVGDGSSLERSQCADSSVMPGTPSSYESWACAFPVPHGRRACGEMVGQPSRMMAAMVLGSGQW